MKEDKNARRERNLEEAKRTVESHFYKVERFMHTEMCSAGIPPRRGSKTLSGGTRSGTGSLYSVGDTAFTSALFAAIGVLLLIFAVAIPYTFAKIAFGVMAAVFFAALISTIISPYVSAKRKTYALLFTNRAIYVVNVLKRSPVEFIYYADIDEKLKVSENSIRISFAAHDEYDSDQLVKAYSEKAKKLKDGGELPMAQLRCVPIVLKVRLGRHTGVGMTAETLYAERCFGVDDGVALAKKIFEIEKTAKSAGEKFPLFTPPDSMVLPD